MAEVSERSGEIDGLPVFWRTAAVPAQGDAAAAPAHGDGAAVPAQGDGAAVPLYLHGVPSSSREWIPFLERGGGIAPDLPGFGRSGKPGSRTYTMAEYDRFIESFLDAAGVQRVKLVVHDWGAVGLLFAQRLPERVERIAVINAVPLLAGYRWHRTARLWRTPLLGELAMGTTTRLVLKALSRESNATPGPMPDAWLDAILDDFDQGTQRAILRLYRSSPPAALAAAGSRLSALSCPALVAWGMRDPYIPARFAREYASALGDARLIELTDAGHWPWLDRPDLIESVAGFLVDG